MKRILAYAPGRLLCLTTRDSINIRFHLSYGAIALGTRFSAAAYILFGCKASRLNPIDTLRSM